MKKCPFIYFSYFFVNFISHSDARDENGDKNVAKYSSNIDTVSEDLFVSYFFYWFKSLDISLDYQPLFGKWASAPLRKHQEEQDQTQKSGGNWTYLNISSAF